MNNIIILGAGMVGSAMAVDMAKNHNVTLVDINLKTLESVKQNNNNNISLILSDLNDKRKLSEIVKPYDLVISAVPGFLGFETLKTVINAEKDVVDISFFAEDAFLLNNLALKKGVTAVVDCGVAPGMGNIILGHCNEQMEIKKFECLVGGLPKVRKWPFNYKAPFSPVDVIEEYTRKVRYVENGNIVIKEPLTDIEHIEINGLGTLEAFNSDGLRTLITTMKHIPNMIEKTLRYPGHVEYIKVLKESGFFDKNEIKMNEKKISPIEFTSNILFNEWKLGDKEEEITVMRIVIKGGNKNIVYTLYDEYCKNTETSSMARTTGYTATAVANLVLKGLFKEKGIIPPEFIGKDKRCFDFIMTYLQERDVIYEKETKSIRN
jgi:saccharopine dehydrogenase-like NADP-dependent oxidoreductase